MPVMCVATGCRSRGGGTTENGTKISFHRFPKDKELREKWVRNLRRGEWQPTSGCRLCSLHFDPTCYRGGSYAKSILHSYAVPTVFANQPIVSEKNPRKRRLILKSVNINQPSTSGIHDENVKNPRKRTPIVKSGNQPSTSGIQDENVEPKQKRCRMEDQAPGSSSDTVIQKLVKQLNHYKMLAARRGRKLKNLQRKHSRVAKKVANLETILNELKFKLEAEHLAILKTAIDKDNQIVSRYIMKVQGCSLPKEYPVEIKQFALTLQYLSPRAYEHVRAAFNTVLPHPKTLSRWYRVVNCQPGFTQESLDTIKLCCANSKKTLYAALCIDEMAIRKHIQWDNTKCYGYIDYGIEMESCSDELPLATEALTFMVTCVNEAWKIPVGYFLINGLTGQQKQNLVTQCIRVLNETGIKVIALTFDGAPANAAMATQLGCDLNPERLVTNFKVEEQDVAILYDPCHNIKLIRNAFGEKKVFFDDKGHEISWIYLERLLELQTIEGLHAANKLSAAHIHYENQKMKVKLATQLMSNSVADALQTCNAMNIPGFENCEATVRFIRQFNDLFDILNSRNFASYGLKKPLNSKNIVDARARLLEIDQYIDGLKFSDGTLLINSRKKTGFLGFKICIKSVLFIYDKYISESNAEFHFLPVYKLSQDHVEVFFSAIRSLGGFNNNPSAYAFMSAYKKLLVHAEFKISRNGNCLPLDDIRVLHSSNPKYVETINETSQRAKLLPDFDDFKQNTEDENFDHDYVFSPNLSEFSEMIVVYIAGYVTRKLKKKIVCEPCCKALEGNNEEKHVSSSFVSSTDALVTIKDKGGLQRASSDVITICSYTEKVFRNFLHTVGLAAVNRPNTVLKMTIKVFNMCGRKNIFEQLIAHSTENCVSNNHLHLLIKCIVDVYLKGSDESFKLYIILTFMLN